MMKLLRKESPSIMKWMRKWVLKNSIWGISLKSEMYFWQKFYSIHLCWTSPLPVWSWDFLTVLRWKPLKLLIHRIIQAHLWKKKLSYIHIFRIIYSLDDIGLVKYFTNSQHRFRRGRPLKIQPIPYCLNIQKYSFSWQVYKISYRR